MKFPQRHRQAMLDPADPVHDACDFLVPDPPYECLGLVKVNGFLHDPNTPDPWPPCLVAFASNGCGDYFAYDLRDQPPRIRYMCPDRTVDEHLRGVDPDSLVFDSFEDWYRYKVKTTTERR
jgi:hypothetical protein